MLVTADVDGASWAEEDKRLGMPLGLSWKTTSLRSPISLPILLIQRYYYEYSCQGSAVLPPSEHLCGKAHT